MNPTTLPGSILAQDFIGPGVLGVLIKNVTTNVSAGADNKQFSRFTFASPNNNFNIQSGLMLSTGYNSDFAGSGTYASRFTSAHPNPTSSCISGDICGPSDTDLNSLTAPNATNNVAVLEFDFLARADTVYFKYIFASEEYPEYVCGQFNDAFGFFVSGPNFQTPTNIATIPGSNPALPVAINSINSGIFGPTGILQKCTPPNGSLAYSNLYISSNAGAAIATEFDGLTVTLEASIAVQPLQWYHIKLAIGDAFDVSFDSAIFLDSASFSSTLYYRPTDPNNPSNIVVESCQGAMK